MTALATGTLDRLRTDLAACGAAVRQVGDLPMDLPTRARRRRVRAIARANGLLPATYAARARAALVRTIGVTL